MHRQPHGNRARSRTHIHNARRRKLACQRNSMLHKVFCLRSRNQHIRSYAKRQPIKLRLARDVLDGLTAVAPLHQFRIAVRAFLTNSIVAIRDQPCPVCFQQVQQQSLGIHPRTLCMGPRCKPRRSLLNRVCKCHG